VNGTVLAAARSLVVSIRFTLPLLSVVLGYCPSFSFTLPPLAPSAAER
jgi:hypothetical protein